MSKAMEQAQQIKDTADSLGWTLHVKGTILTITKDVANRDEFVQADGEYYSILGKLPTTSPGSIWGTDGGGMGGAGIVDGGTFRMNKSGGSKRVLSALAKLI